MAVSQRRITAVSLSLALLADASHLPQWLMVTHTTPLLCPYIFCTSEDRRDREEIDRGEELQGLASRFLRVYGE